MFRFEDSFEYLGLILDILTGMRTELEIMHQIKKINLEYFQVRSVARRIFHGLVSMSHLSFQRSGIDEEFKKGHLQFHHKCCSRI